MNPAEAIETMLEGALASASSESPRKLLAAMRYAVFPGGARLRPKLCLSVAWACGADDERTAAGAAAAIELLHCASLVHDDMPCFDDADTRRGKPSVHRAFSEPLALLTGDALIVMAFDVLAVGAQARPLRLSPLVRIVSAATGANGGIAAGQAWECEPHIDLSRYHRAKTGALFSAATMAGAAAAGQNHEPWRQLGECLGEAYQIADDIRDVVCDPEQLGKPVGRDEALLRPSACRELGIRGAIGKLSDLVDQSVASIPHCKRASELGDLIRLEASRFLPAEVAELAA
ncbi:MAG: polyprenyl synthetase family protein [Beijerinckiaceae bacterium]|nr:polyprenyl synthetase family protein [Beijerinckiaceae bacterium]